ncbi:MAG TPA: hypothetical protein PKE27_08615 [Povalibacter sp.]|uniref:hypothetical protein n=1 Tax=Povalibacter sp. TaxID=1962978 RepID=UPI002C4B54DB|nr:hypothetical protein [Povalibacter sp.]HMN44620.1 hypothetical protein [Povalibacter sp.]
MTVAAANGGVTLTIDGKPAVVPMAPTNLRVDFSPTAELVNRIFSNEGISKNARTLVYAHVTKLEKGDLIALTKGMHPSELGLAMPSDITEDRWMRLTGAYAEAILSDRARRFELWQNVGLAVLGMLLGVVGTLLALRLARPAPAVTPPIPQVTARGSRKKRRRR